jgi:heat shock protein HslJ
MGEERMRRRDFLIGVLAAVPLSAMAAEAKPRLEETRWRLSSFGYLKMAVPDNIWIRLEGGRFEGNAGCNGLSGEYERQGSRIRFRQGPATRMACPNIGMEARFRRLLEEVESWEIKGGRLLLKRGGSPLLIFGADTKSSR